MILKIKQILKFMIFPAITAFMTFLVVQGQIVTNQAPLESSLISNKEVANSMPISYRSAIVKSRNSSVRILSLDMDKGLMSTSSATYIKFKNNNYVLTTHHGLMGGCDTIQIEADGELYDCLEVVKVDKNTDYALLMVEEVPSRIPIKYPQDFTRNPRQWKKTLSLMNDVIYTGYPNSIGPLTIDGSIMGYDQSGYIYINSYAWSGSSGSGVFDSKGRVIGYIVAIDVGRTEYGLAILENVMLVVPIYKVDWSSITRRK